MVLPMSTCCFGEQIHMAANDYAGGIEACMRLGDASRGGNPQLWTDMLDYLTQQEDDVTTEVLPEHSLLWCTACQQASSNVLGIPLSSPLVCAAVCGLVQQGALDIEGSV